MDKRLRERALSLYEPPFRFQYGFIFDKQGNMVADNSCGDDGEVADADGNMLLRVRGWGRISYMEDPERLQDAVGELLVAALNEYWRSQCTEKGNE